MASVKFKVVQKIENAQIYIRFSINRKLVFQIKTGLLINYKNWSFKTGLPTQNKIENKKLTITLKSLETYIFQNFNNDSTSGVVIDKFWFINIVDSFFNRIDEDSDINTVTNYILYLIDRKKNEGLETKSSKSKLKVLHDRFSDFQKFKSKIFLLSDIDAQLINEFNLFLKKQYNYMDSTANGFIKKLKTVLFNARYNGKQIHHQINGYKVGKTTSDNKIYLSLDEIELVKKTKVLLQDHIIAKDWLILGCFLGQRIGDLFGMKKEMIFSKVDNEGNSFRFIEIKQQKTKTNVIIPLHFEVEEILNKYNGSFPPLYEGTYDSITVLFNRYIKIICEQAGIHDVVLARVYDDKLKKNLVKEVEKCYVISSHVCRRSFATNFYGNKMFTTPQLMAITGHKTESMFLEYIGKSSDDWAMQTAKTFREIENQKIL